MVTLTEIFSPRNNFGRSPLPLRNHTDQVHMREGPYQRRDLEENIHCISGC